MALGKRKRVSRARAASTAMRVGNWASLVRASRAAKGRRRPRISLSSMNQRLNSLSSTIETKSGVWSSGSNVSLPHNQIHIVTSPGNGQGGDRLNMFQIAQGVRDEMGSGQVQNRVGDKITVRGVLIRAMFENSLNRPKVFYRLMVIKCAKGDVPDNASLFQRNSTNRMIDQLATERYTIIASKKFTISVSNAAPSLANATNGAPEESDFTSVQNAGMGTKMVNMWIPGSKFFRKGVLQYNCSYDSQNNVTPKFFDFYVVILTYDWYGTPTEIAGVPNNVGKLNSLYTKCYFKDA